MSYQLIVFTDPPNAIVKLTLDNGLSLVAKDGFHTSGRPGKVITIPEGNPNGNGARLVITAKDKVTIEQRGILFLFAGEATFQVDDFYLMSVPTPIKLPPDKEPPKEPLLDKPETPLQIIKRVYKFGLFNLQTKEGCGTFTEAVVKELHEKHSTHWGHIRKIPPQNHYPENPYVTGGNVHAVDAIMLLAKATDGTEPGIYDIVYSSESPDARPEFNFKGPPVPGIWYYPL